VSATVFSSYPEARSFDCCRRRISEATRISRPSALLAAKPRVAPDPRTSCCASRCSLQVAPRAAPSGFTGDRSSRRVEVRMLRRCRLIVSGLPHTRSFGIADDQVPGCPRTCIFRHQLMNLPELPRFAHPPVSPGRISGSPRSFFGLWLLRLTWHHIAMALRSFGGADELSSGSPRDSVPRLWPPLFLGSPRFPSTAGSMMNPSCPRTLHPRLAPRMNLRVQSGFALPA